MKNSPLLRSFLLLGLAVSLLTLGRVSADDLKFGAQAKPWTIVLNADAPDTVKFAAKELSEYIARVTGAPTSVTSSPGDTGANTIYLGNTPFAREQCIQTENLPPDGFRIRSGENWIVIAGKDYLGEPLSGTDNPYRINETYNDRVKLSAFGDAGTLQGVYYFLRQYFGVRWYMPGELGEVVPSKVEVEVPPIDLEKSPAFSYRYPYFCFFSSSDRDSIWYRRAGFGAPFPVEIMHSFDRFLKYKDSNPEFFAIIDGQRDFTTLSSILGPGNLNLSEPGLLKQVIADINEYFDKNPSKMLYPIVPPDGMRRISDDPVSQAQIDLSMGNDGKFSDYVWGFINKVAAGVREKHPDKFIGGIAYENYNTPPKKIEKLEPNVVVMICKQRRKSPDAAYEAAMKKSIEDWMRKASSIYIWEYYCDILFNSGWRGYPVFYPGIIHEDLKFLKGKVKGEMIEAESWTTDQQSDLSNIVINAPGLQHPQLYVTSVLLWDPDQDLGAITDEYYKLFYGSAEKEMRAFWETVEKSWLEKTGLAPVNVYSNATTLKLLGHLDQGIKVTEPGSIYRKRIELIKNEFAATAAKVARLADLKLPEAVVPKVAKDQPVTAVLANSFWDANIPVLSLIDASYRKAVPPTHVRVAWTERALKLSVVCFEPQMDKVVATATDQPEPPSIFNDDAVEFFLKPDKGAARTYHFAVNSNGVIYDAKNVTSSYADDDTSWSSAADVVVKKEHDRWIVEASIPWFNLEIEKPKSGDQILANFYRTRVVKGAREEFSWSPVVEGLYFSPKDFGRLTLGE